MRIQDGEYAYTSVTDGAGMCHNTQIGLTVIWKADLLGYKCKTRSNDIQCRIIKTHMAKRKKS